MTKDQHIKKLQKYNANQVKYIDELIEKITALTKNAFKEGTRVCTNLDDHDLDIIWDGSESKKGLKDL